MATDQQPIPSPSEQKPKITLHWLEKSRAQRILWLLTECEPTISYEIVLYKRNKDYMGPATLKKIHPLGKSPVISIEAPGLASPLVVAESALITQYVTEHFAPHLMPVHWQSGKEGAVGGETEEWMRYQYFLHYAEGSLMGTLFTYYIVRMLRDGPEIPFFIKPITRMIVNKMEAAFFLPAIKTHLSFLEEQLATSPGGGQYLCGEKLTAADILMSFPLWAGRKGEIGLTSDKYPKLTAYIERLEGLESYKKSVKIAEEKTGEKYEIL